MRSAILRLRMFALRFVSVVLVVLFVMLRAGVALAAGPVVAAYVATSDTFEIENVTSAAVEVVVTTGADDTTLTVPGRSEIFVARGGGNLVVRYNGDTVAQATAGTSTAPAAPQCDAKAATIYAGQPGSVRNVDTNVWSFFGTALNDVIVGTSGADTIDTGDGTNSVCAGAGDDTIRGGTSRDVLTGEAGNDTLYVDGLDGVRGGPGFDTVNATLSPTGITLDLGANGIERVYGSTKSDVLFASQLPDGASAVVIFGNDGSDQIRGTTGADTLHGDGGGDQIIGGDGADTIEGGAMDDTLVIDGLDSINGGPGYDVADGTLSPTPITLDLGARGIEYAYGSAGNDTFTSSIVPDSQGRVVIRGRGGDDQISGSPGPDTLYGDAGKDTIDGGGEADIIEGGADDDTVRGGDGMDILYGQDGADVLDGGADDDTIHADDADISVRGGLGADTSVRGGLGIDTVDFLSALGGVTFDLGSNGFEQAYGTAFDDTFTSNVLPDSDPRIKVDARGGNDTLVGTSGVDTLTGNTGNDTLIGHSNADFLFGGPGDDTLYCDGLDNSVVGGTGYDRAYASSSSVALELDLGPNGIELAVGTPFGDTFLSSILPDGDTKVTIYGRGGPDTITGSSGPDLLMGDDANDIIDGAGGADALYGGSGNDTIFIDNADTTVRGGDGFDTVDALKATAPVTLDIGEWGFEQAFGTNGNDTIGSTAIPDGASGIVVYGRDGNDTLTGTTGPDMLYGEAGMDTLSGDDGADRLSGGLDADTLLGGAGNDQLYGEAGADILRGEGGDDRVYPDTSDTETTGGSGVDTVDGLYASELRFDLGANGFEIAFGSLGNDVLTSSVLPDGATRVQMSGRSGDDLLIGTAGNDILQGGAGVDDLRGEGGHRHADRWCRCRPPRRWRGQRHAVSRRRRHGDPGRLRRRYGQRCVCDAPGAGPGSQRRRDRLRFGGRGRAHCVEASRQRRPRGDLWTGGQRPHRGFVRSRPAVWRGGQ